LTAGTDPVELEALMNVSVASTGDYLGYRRPQVDVQVLDGAAHTAHEVGMGERVATIIAGSAIEGKLQNLLHLLQTFQRVVDGGEAGGGEVVSHLTIDLVHAGVALALDEDPDDSEPLGRDAMPGALELCYDIIQAHFAGVMWSSSFLITILSPPLGVSTVAGRGRGWI
jgi:hypothetical protein